MEQRRFPGNSHWYHETQSTLTPHAAPLFPEAAEIEDRFLLGLAQQYADTLGPTISQCQPAMLASRDLYQLLLPQQLATSKTHTLTIYDRLSTALTVAQVTGIQRLCNHYAARLNPLSGPDSSRESNRRLTQITEYARQLASQPTLVDSVALARLDEVGLTAPDIVTFHQLIGFVSYQARIVAGMNALLALPVRWIPGVTLPEDAASDCFQHLDAWRPFLPPVELRYASASQLEALTWCQPQQLLRDSAWLLAHDGEALYGWGNLLNAMQDVTGTEAGRLASAVSARINGSPLCFQQFADASLREALLESVEQALNKATAEQKAVIHCAAQLTRSPERFSAAHLQPLKEAGFSDRAVFSIVQSIALAAWNNRLMQALGSTAPAVDSAR
ncbi:CMD domain-containing protein [Erwinia billingiae]|uniref:CMD domain-containing protein n=1 Tax=Erwinia billingiae TaxID=182337 RepID=UPI002247C31C|nr:oxidoreductase [Erwinia billingiae]MCX0500429.1 oxidoreductase [Erwinia billingiae]